MTRDNLIDAAIALTLCVGWTSLTIVLADAVAKAGYGPVAGPIIVLIPCFSTLVAWACLFAAWMLRRRDIRGDA